MHSIEEAGEALNKHLCEKGDAIGLELLADYTRAVQEALIAAMIAWRGDN